jgi:glycosyltransferase involved in cell wall biosynthesis
MDHLSFLRGKRVLLATHELSLTGAPLMLMELAGRMADAGAHVVLTNFGWHEETFPKSLLSRIKLCDIEQAVHEADDSALIIANTAVAKTWVRTLLVRRPAAARKLIWWVHEIHTNWFGDGMDCLGQAACALFDSHACVSAWRETGLAMPPLSCAIHLCVDSSFAAAADNMLRDGAALRQAARAELEVGDDDVLLSLFATYEPRKGQDPLIATLGRMLEAEPALPLKLLLIGFHTAAPPGDFLGRLTPAERLAITPARALMRKVDLRPYYLASDAYVMNSQPPGEPFGRVTIEAMAFRLPVLGSAMGGTVEIVVDSETGWLHPAGPEGEEALQQNIRTLINDRAEARRRGMAGQRRVQRYFCEDRFYRELAEVFKAVLAGSRSS